VLKNTATLSTVNVYRVVNVWNKLKTSTANFNTLSAFKQFFLNNNKDNDDDDNISAATTTTQILSTLEAEFRHRKTVDLSKMSV